VTNILSQHPCGELAISTFAGEHARSVSELNH